MRILKFGGTSLANAQKFLHVADIIEKKIKNEQIAIVLSAPAKVTNYLIEIIEKAVKNENFDLNVKKLKHTLNTIAKKIHITEKFFSFQELKDIIENEFINLNNTLHGIKLLNQCPKKIYAKIICLGEILSIHIMKSILISRCHNITIINPIEKLLSIGNYLDSTIDINESTKRIQDMNIPKNNTILMSGFIAGNYKKELVVLGRNGSDYSAAVLAVCLKANYCEIWTDVDGIYTCDPKKVSNARLLKSLTYQEAMELSYFGAKVLHPKTISPIAEFQIPCLIKNTCNIEASGTLISNRKSNNENYIKGITHLNNIAMFNVSGPGMKEMIGVVKRVFSAISKKGIWIVLTTQSSSTYNICFCVLQKDIKKTKNILQEEFYLELQNGLLKPIDILDDLAIISIIGTEIRTKCGISAKIFSALSKTNINIIAIAQGSSENSISIVIKNDNVINGIKAVHQTLFCKNQIIEIFLIGIGNIGTTLLNQIYRQQNWIKKQNIELKICGIANTKKIFN